MTVQRNGRSEHFKVHLMTEECFNSTTWQNRFGDGQSYFKPVISLARNLVLGKGEEGGVAKWCQLEILLYSNNCKHRYNYTTTNVLI